MHAVLGHRACQPGLDHSGRGREGLGSGRPEGKDFILKAVGSPEIFKWMFRSYFCLHPGVQIRKWSVAGDGESKRGIKYGSLAGGSGREERPRYTSSRLQCSSSLG